MKIILLVTSLLFTLTTYAQPLAKSNEALIVEDLIGFYQADVVTEDVIMFRSLFLIEGDELREAIVIEDISGFRSIGSVGFSRGVVVEDIVLSGQPVELEQLVRVAQELVDESELAGFFLLEDKRGRASLKALVKKQGRLIEDHQSVPIELGVTLNGVVITEDIYGF